MIVQAFCREAFANPPCRIQAKQGSLAENKKTRLEFREAGVCRANYQRGGSVQRKIINLHRGPLSLWLKTKLYLHK